MATNQRQKLIQFLKGMSLSGEIIEEIADYVNENYKVKAPKQDFSYIDKLIDIFCLKYLESRNIKYDIASKGIERSAVGRLIKIYNSHPENKLKTTEQSFEDYENLFKLCLSIEDKYMYANMNLTYISLNINKIKLILNATKTNVRADKNRSIAESIQQHFTSEK